MTNQTQQKPNSDPVAAPPVGARLLELAEEQARRNHENAIYAASNGHPNEGHVGSRGDSEGFSACPHPDCELVRGAPPVGAEPRPLTINERRQQLHKSPITRHTMCLMIADLEQQLRAAPELFTRAYVCGCSATGTRPLPLACPDHDATDIPLEVRQELMRCAIAHGDLSYVYLCDLFRRGRAEAMDVLRLILAEPHGCPMCDSGTLRNPDKEHWDRCGFAQAQALIERAAGPSAASREERKPR